MHARSRACRRQHEMAWSITRLNGRLINSIDHESLGCHPRRRADANREVRRLVQGRASRRARRRRRARGASRARASTPADVDEVLDRPRPAGRLRTQSRRGRSAHRAGIPDAAPAQTINKACASGMQAIAQRRAGDSCSAKSDVVLAGGIESMSRMPYLDRRDDARWGHRMGQLHARRRDVSRRLHCSLSRPDHGRDGGGARARVRHHARGSRTASRSRASSKAEAAIAAGRFTRRDRAGHRHRRRRARAVDADRRRASARRHDASRACGSCRWCSATSKGSRASSPPAPRRASPTAAPRWCSRRRRRARGARTEAAGADPRLGERRRRSAASWASARCRRCRSCCERTGLGARRLRSRRAERSVRAAGARRAARPADSAGRLNVNGGAIALGHPIGCTGTRIVVTLLHEMRRRGARRGLATLCVSGGMGMAMAIERI